MSANPAEEWQLVVIDDEGDVVNCACGTSLVRCVRCGESRCLSCDPYEESDDCA